MSEIFQKMEEQSWKYIQFYLRPRNILEKSIYLFFNIKGAPLMVEDTPVLMSLAFSQIKLRRRTGLLWSLLSVVLILAFTFIGGMVTGGNPLISYSQYMSGVWKQRGEILHEIFRELRNLQEKAYWVNTVSLLHARYRKCIKLKGCQ